MLFADTVLGVLGEGTVQELKPTIPVSFRRSYSIGGVKVKIEKNKTFFHDICPQNKERAPFIIFPGLVSFSRFLGLLPCVLGTQSHMPSVTSLSDSTYCTVSIPKPQQGPSSLRANGITGLWEAFPIPGPEKAE